MVPLSAKAGSIESNSFGNRIQLANRLVVGFGEREGPMFATRKALCAIVLAGCMFVMAAPANAQYYRHGGILEYVLRQLRDGA